MTQDEKYIGWQARLAKEAQQRANERVKNYIAIAMWVLVIGIALWSWYWRRP